MFRQMILPALAVISLAIAAPVIAAPPKASAAPAVSVQRDASGRLVYVFKKGWIVPGTIQRPNAQYFISRSKIDYSAKPLRQIFIKRVLDAVRRAPF